MGNKEILDIVISSKGISTDTRTIKKGQAFFALKGDNFNGNEYVEIALEKGAIVAISSDKKFDNYDKVIVVEDTLVTLQEISNLHRKNCNIPVIAITGTNGKTTTKEITSILLSAKFNVLSTDGNFNNHIGVPLTLLKLKSEHQIAIIEMGASAPGEIDRLCKIAEPTHGLITSIGKAHIEGFGSMENILKTKLELFDYLKENGGIFFFNLKVNDLSLRVKDKSGVVAFSSKNMNSKIIRAIELKEVYPFLKILIIDNNDYNTIVTTQLYGSYNFTNLINAIKIALFFEVGLQGIIDKLMAFVPQNNRSQILSWKSNQVILDAYNANPTSMREAIKSFEKIDSNEPKYLVLGDMLEMGQKSVDEHVEIIQYIISNNIYSDVFLIGEEFLKAGESLSTKPNNINFLSNSLIAKEKIELLEISNSLILVKGSRGIKTETIFI